MKTRLFIGNLAPTVTEKDLREKFEALFSDHKNETEVGNVEVRCKNESNFFGYVDVHSKNEVPDGGKVPLHLRKYIDLMNNTKWKGSLIKVQVAKESFIDKLRREQQQNRHDGSNPNAKTDHGNHKNTEESNTEQSRNQRQAMDVLQKMNKSRDKTKGRHLNGQNKNFESNDGNKAPKCDFEIVSAEKDKKSPVKASSPPKQKKKRRRKSESSSSSDDSDDDIRDGIPKFKGLLLSYPEGIPPPAPPAETVAQSPKGTSSKKKNRSKVETENLAEVEEERPLIQQKLLDLAFESDRPKHSNQKQNVNSEKNASRKLGNEVNPTSSVINFKKSKQQKSDQLRQQSLEKLKDLKTQRKNLIKSSLATVTAAAPVTEKRKVFEAGAEEDEEFVEEPESKKKKMTLFDEEENDEDGDNEDDRFGVKMQFEGVQGQKLLEMQTRWGNDERFKIDDRFKESDDDSDNNEEEHVEKEKEKQMNILTDILGKDFTSVPKESSKKTKKSVPSNTFSSVILPRYDPEAEEEKDEDTCNAESKSKKSKKTKKEADTVAPTVEEPKPIRSTEPATYKTASNLKEMFSSSHKDEEAKLNEKQSEGLKINGSSMQSSFSLLAAFGSTPDEEDDETAEEISRSGKKKSLVEDSSSGPRSFWQSNPFRYDSSDDEDDSKTTKERKSAAENVKPNVPSDMKVHGKASFFFTDNDKRFEELEDYFLKLDDYEGKSEGDKDNKDSGSGRVEDFSEKRQELKAIVKAKIRNSKRKDEKRTLAIKRAIRKRKRKIHQNKRMVPTK